MVNQDIDKIFKEKFSGYENMPDSFKWNKNIAWGKLRKRKIRNRVLKFSVSVAAILIFIFSISYLSNFNDVSLQSNSYEEDEYIEFQKRQKLLEIELRMSGKNVYKTFCFNCDQFLPEENSIKYTKESIRIYQEFYQ